MNVNIKYELINLNLSTWTEHIYNACEEIARIAPGIKFVYNANSKFHKFIAVLISKEENLQPFANTRKNIIDYPHALIKLAEGWPEKQRLETATHELLHALGLGHEHQREDRKEFGLIIEEKNDNDNFHKSQIQLQQGYPLTIYDPYSIMHYPGDEYMYFDKDSKQKVYYLLSHVNPNKPKSSYMSNLDQIAVNLLYNPVKRKDENCKYDPKINKQTGLYYCGREKIINRKQTCGPKQGPNCCACRVLVNSDLPQKK